VVAKQHDVEGQGIGRRGKRSNVMAGWLYHWPMTVGMGSGASCDVAGEVQ
jgi:hypothetical protein